MMKIEKSFSVLDGSDLPPDVRLDLLAKGHYEGRRKWRWTCTACGASQLCASQDSATDIVWSHFAEGFCEAPTETQ